MMTDILQLGAFACIVLCPPYFEAFSSVATSKASLLSKMTATTTSRTTISRDDVIFNRHGTKSASMTEDETGVEKNSVFFYDDSSWDAYENAIAEAIMKTRKKKNFKDRNMTKCRNYIISRDRYLSSVPDVMEIFRKATPEVLSTNSVHNHPDSKTSVFKTSMKKQEYRFRQCLNFTSDEYEFVSRALVKLGDLSAKNITLNSDIIKVNGTSYHNEIDHRLPVALAWYKMKEMGFIPKENSLSTYMYILSCSHGHEFGSNDGSDSGEIVPVVEDELLEVVTCHDRLYRKNEKTLTILMKSLVGRGRIQEAEEIFASSFDHSGICRNPSDSKDATAKNRQRLRTYMPLMEYYCQVGDLTSILRLYRKMQDSASVHWDVESYTTLISSLARFGYFFTSNDHERSDVTDYAYGPDLFDSMVSNMADDILEITETAFQDVAEAFRIGNRDHLTAKAITDFNVVVERVTIPKMSGICPITGIKLRLLSINNTQLVHDTLLEMARTSTEMFIDMNNDRQLAFIEKQRKEGKSIKHDKNKNVKNNVIKEDRACSKVYETREINKESYGYQELLKFSKWLDDREGEAFTAVVDGANVGYYGHNRLHYSSIRRMIEKLESFGERPLLVMPEKYTQNSFNGFKKHQQLTVEDLEVIEWLREKEIMYIVPRLVLDDYFWMLASVSNQTNSNHREDLKIHSNDNHGGFAGGLRPILVTNDQMRDHKLDLLKPREFRRWCSCHIVNYHISAFQNDEWEEGRNISFVPADLFSYEIQANADKGRNGNVWHFPIHGSLDWLCIWIKISKNDSESNYQSD